MNALPAALTAIPKESEVHALLRGEEPVAEHVR